MPSSFPVPSFPVRGARPPSAFVASGALLAALLAGTGPHHVAGATLTFTESGISASGNPVTASATLTTSGTMLMLELRSVGPKTQVSDDVLTSFYFDVTDPRGGPRIVLTYLAASGTACQVLRGAGNDRFVSWQTTPTQQLFTTGTAALAPSNLVARVPGDSGWQFKDFTGIAPIGGFGIGTVGNSTIATVAGPAYAGATFDPQVVSQSGPPGKTMINLGIYSNGNQPLPGDIDAGGDLDGATLVNTRAAFLFGSSRPLDTFGPDWVPRHVTFGFGTGPSSVLLPEPGGIALAVTAVAGLLWWGRRRRGPAASARHGPAVRRGPPA